MLNLPQPYDAALANSLGKISRESGRLPGFKITVSLAALA